MDKLNNKKVILTNKFIKNLLDETYKKTIQVSSFLLNGKYSGYESDINTGISSSHMKGQGSNPLLWEFGHIDSFYKQHLLQYLFNDIKYDKLFDSIITNRQRRFNKKLNKLSIFNNYINTYNKCLEWLKNNQLDEKTSYLFLLSILHNHMHIESFIFTKKLLNINNNFNIINNNNNKVNIKFIKINEGYFYQGVDEGEKLLAFDIEKPKFRNFIKSFYIADIPITNLMYLNFIENGGYVKKDIWCEDGWEFIIKNKITNPLYWKLKDNMWYEKVYNNYEKLNLNLPVCHISWYEAKAVAKYYDGRLPTESEWEYVATNEGKTKYPWGNEMNSNYCNVDYNGITNVYNFIKGNTINEVRQMIGNVWEWCSDSIYPYDGYKIDPIYREFSYPFFGFKKVLRGGSYTVPNYLINTKYRNSQLPDMRIQFTGVRIVKDLK